MRDMWTRRSNFLCVHYALDAVSNVELPHRVLLNFSSMAWTGSSNYASLHAYGHSPLILILPSLCMSCSREGRCCWRAHPTVISELNVWPHRAVPPDSYQSAFLLYGGEASLPVGARNVPGVFQSQPVLPSLSSHCAPCRERSV